MPVIAYPMLSARRRTRFAGQAASGFLENTVSVAKSTHPSLATASESLRGGDVLMVWRLDRLGHSLPHLIALIGALEARRVGFRSITESIDTTTSVGG